MASTYSSLKFELIGTGEQSGTWGATTNTNLGTAIEEAITGFAVATFPADSALTLTLTDTNTAQTARNLVINVTSGVPLTATQNLIVPTIEKQYYIFNNTTGGQSINVKTTLGTGVIVPNGGKVVVFVDGVNVVPVINSLPVSSTVTYKLPTADGVSSQVLSTNGSGTLSWINSSSGGASAGGTIYENSLVITSNYTLSASKNGFSVGPITVSSGASVTVPSGQRWVII